MLVLAENPEHRYLQAIFEDEDADTFRERLVKSGSLAGRPVRLSDGRQVGTVLSGAAYPFPFEADGEAFDGAAVMELQFESAEFMKAAREAEIVLEDEAVVLLGEGAAVHAPVHKSRDAQLREELRRGWGLG